MGIRPSQLRVCGDCGYGYMSRKRHQDGEHAVCDRCKSNNYRKTTCDTCGVYQSIRLDDNECHSCVNHMRKCGRCKTVFQYVKRDQRHCTTCVPLCTICHKSKYVVFDRIQTRDDAFYCYEHVCGNCHDVKDYPMRRVIGEYLCLDCVSYCVTCREVYPKHNMSETNPDYCLMCTPRKCEVCRDDHQGQGSWCHKCDGLYVICTLCDKPALKSECCDEYHAHRGCAEKFPECAICLDRIYSPKDVVTCDNCQQSDAPSVSCRKCFTRHVDILQDGFHRVLRPITCPCCVAPLQTRSHLRNRTILRQRDNARALLELKCPRCHNDCNMYDRFFRYHHVDEYHHIKPDTLFFDKYYVHYKISAREAVLHINHYSQLYQLFNTYSSAQTERHAHMLNAFLNKIKFTTTPCCDARVCFPCRATAIDHVCDPNVQGGIKKCPNCTRSLVKGEGCDSITCPCGEQLRWSMLDAVGDCIK